MMELFDIGNREILKSATGFAGGIGNMGSTCGAFTGGVLILGILYGRTSLKHFKEKEETYLYCSKWYKVFVDHFKNSNCRDILGVDLRDSNVRKKYWGEKANREKCAKLVVGETARMLLELIREIEEVH